MQTPNDCRHCGVCCFSESSSFVRVMGDDWARLGGEAERLAHFIGNRAFMRMQAGHCAALAVQGDADGTVDFFCTVYDRRPQVCRDLDRGSPQCAAEIEEKADPVRLLAAAVRAWTVRAELGSDPRRFKASSGG